MKNNEKWTAVEYPEDIAGAITYKLYDGAIDTEKADMIREQLTEALTDLMAAAQNEYNRDSFRVFYDVMEDLKNDIEEDIPFWDRED